MIEDDFIANLDDKRTNNLEFLHVIRHKFKLEKEDKKHNLRTEGIGNPTVPIWFTYEEIKELLDKIEGQLKNREIY
jgi:hypothetical protein